jgi:GT2 family glycosyltransferase
MSEDLRLGVVIVNYGSHRLIADGLDAAGLRGAGIEVVVVDNLSTQTERGAVAELCAAHGWVLVAQAGNAGFGAGVNAGVVAARSAGCNAIVTLNPDARATPEVLIEMGRHVLSEPLALVSPAMVTSQGTPHFRGSTVSLCTGQIRGGWCSDDGDPEWKNWLSGACLAFNPAGFDRLGGFDPRYFLYWEDVDLSRRAAAAGLSLRLREDLQIIHDEGGTHGELRDRSKSPLYYFYNTRNRLLFAANLLSPAQVWRWVLVTPRQSALIWLRGGKRQLLTEPAGAFAAVGGSVIGLCIAIAHLFRVRMGAR